MSDNENVTCGCETPCDFTLPPPEPKPTETFYDRILRHENCEDTIQAFDQNALEEQHNSLMDVMAAAPVFEGEFVLKRLRRGKVNGHTFGNADRSCSCLLGTMASAANIYGGGKYGSGQDLEGEMEQTKGVMTSKAQHLFGGIDKGDKPSNNTNAALADQFITELLMSNRAELGREERAALRRLAKHGLKF